MICRSVLPEEVGMRQAAHLVAAAVQARAAGEQAVAVADLAHILIGAARGHNGPCAAVFPQVNVMLGVECHHALARGAGGGLNADAIPQRPGHQPIGIGFPADRPW